MSVLAAADEVELCASRLKHVCHRIAEARRPYCPLNGIVVLAPLAATDSDADANQLAAVVQRDLEVLAEEFCVSCPVVAVLCDLEQLPGCEQFIERMPGEQRGRRLGVTFPHVSAGDARHVPAMIADGLRWLCQDLCPSLVYRLMPTPRPQANDAERELAGNVRRYQFLCQMRQREGRLARILARGIAPGVSPWQLRGCYLAATGADAARQQAFVAGIFPPLAQLQNAVAWTPAALREDGVYRLWARLGYAGLAVTVIATVALLVF
jgi:type VI protein secretion system component VasK